MSVRQRLAGALSALDARHRRRRLIPAQGLDFASNDYLGLTGSDLLQTRAAELIAAGVPVGAGGSRLLRGNHPEHEALEQAAAQFFGTDAALFMGGGFQANQALFSTLPAAGDLVLFDDEIHASAHEGMRLGRADLRSFAHNDVTAAEDTLRKWRAEGGQGNVWIAVESVYSMSGHVAPLADFAALAVQHNAVLVVDEAHATGVFGTKGQGLAHDLPGEILTLHTCGKGLGVSGGLICGAQEMIDTIINRARPFIFATAPSPLTAGLVNGALNILKNSPKLVTAARARRDHAHQLAQAHCGVEGLQSQIIPIIIGEDQSTMDLAAALQNAGFDVRGIRPPTVARGTSRLRISITGNVTRDDITHLFETLAKLQGTS